MYYARLVFLFAPAITQKVIFKIYMLLEIKLKACFNSHIMIPLPSLLYRDSGSLYAVSKEDKTASFQPPKSYSPPANI